MRLLVDVYFDGQSDVEYMTESVKDLVEGLFQEYISTDELEPVSIVLPLGRITLTKELNPVKERANDDNSDNALSFQN